MRRSILLLALTVMFAAAACGASASTPTGVPASAVAASTISGPAASASATADPTASASVAPDDTVWLCKPGLADNPCAGSLDATVIDATGASTVQPASPAADPPIDCFYVYPTVSRQTTTNANLTIDPEERAVAVAQAARFSQVCHVYAPMYPQLTLAAIAKPSQITLGSALNAYSGVASAFGNYMTHYNHGRGVVFIGHSQGAMMLTVLLKYQVDPNPGTRRLLVSALLLGGNVTVPLGKSVGGDFANIPACSSGTQTGCVVAYSSFDTTPPAGAAFGRVGTAINLLGGGSTASRQILCVNPAAPGGGTAALEPYFPAAGLSRFLGSAAGAPTIATAFVTYSNQYAAHCVTSGGATWLQIDRTAGTSDVLPTVSAVEAPTWGLHLVDVNIALGNLVDLVRTEAAAFH